METCRRLPLRYPKSTGLLQKEPGANPVGHPRVKCGGNDEGADYANGEAPLDLAAKSLSSLQAGRHEAEGL